MWGSAPWEIPWFAWVLIGLVLLVVVGGILAGIIADVVISHLKEDQNDEGPAEDEPDGALKRTAPPCVPACRGHCTTWDVLNGSESGNRTPSCWLMRPVGQTPSP